MFVVETAYWQCDRDGAVSGSVTSTADVPDGWLTGLSLAAPGTPQQVINDLCPACAGLAVSAAVVPPS